MTERQESRLVQHARRELALASMMPGQVDAPYDGMVSQAALELVEVFARQGHSGGSAELTLTLFNHLAKFRVLTPITDDPAEWNDVAFMADRPLWQSTRRPDAFSEDGGHTYYSVNDRRPWWRRLLGLRKAYRSAQSGKAKA